MRLLRPTVVIAAFLIIAFSAPPSLYSQTAPKPSPPKRPAPRQSHPKRPQRADALAPAINELLKLDPLLPRSPDSDSPDTSERKEKPPGDDAPIRELIKYWLENRYAATSEAQEPSERVRQRLLEAVEDRPWLAHSLIELLPETPDTSDRLYKLINQELDDEDGWKWRVHDWLSHNSGYFRDDLLAEVRSTDHGETQTAAALKSLSRLDWEAARPFIESYATGNGAILAPTALSLLYEHEMKFGDAAKVEDYRAGLKAMVANRQAPEISRGGALATLMATEWSGREEWFAALFADPSLSGQRETKENEPDGKEGTKDATAKLEIPLIIAPEFHRPPPANLLSMVAPETGELIPVVSSLIGHSSRTIHNAAVEWLANVMKGDGDPKQRREVARKLLPWLTDPSWVDEGDRASFIAGFADLELPESVAGLTWVLDFDESAGNRAAAAGALAQFRNPSVNPALRRALEREVDEERRGHIVEALADCGGFSDDEAAAAIEAYVKAASDEEDEMDVDHDQPEDGKKPPPLEVSIGRSFSENLSSQFTEGLAVKLIERAKALRATQPKVARSILRVLEGLSLRVAKINLVERIGEGWADVDTLTFAIYILRDSLRKSAFDELNGLIKQGSYAAGVAAAILNEEREWKEMLEGRDAKAQLALLACARYLRDKLPVEPAGRLLGSQNRALAKAAESYLKVEDSAAARKLIFARHPGEAYILGDDPSLANFPSHIEVMKQWEEEMRREVKGQSGPEEIYALGHAYESKTFTGAVIRIRGGMAEISVYEDPIRLSYRQLTPVEFEELKSFTARQEVEDLGPEDVSRDWKYLSASGGSGTPPLFYEYLRLNKDGGRRIVICSMRRAPKNPTLHEELGGMFHKLTNSGEFKVRYALEARIPGLEVMWADKKQPVLSVCQEKGELRVLTGNPFAYFFKGLNAQSMPVGLKRAFAPALAGRFISDSEPALPEWRIFTKDGIGAVASDTPACRSASVTFSPATSVVYQTIGGFSTQITISPGDSEEVYAVPEGKDRGVWKAELGRDPVKLLDDAYQSVLALPDGKWLIGRKVIIEGGKRVTQLVRHNLRTNEAFPIVFSREGHYRPLSFSEAHGKVLIVDGDAMSPQAKGYLLDIETGATQAVSGDFRPIAEDGTRNLQPAGKPNEFWAAIFDHQKQATIVGRYDAKLFAFKPLIQLPELRFDSSGAWVDQTTGMLWMVYRGCLLRLPLPK
jgi:hypothetical protein